MKIRLTTEMEMQVREQVSTCICMVNGNITHMLYEEIRELLRGMPHVGIHAHIRDSLAECREDT